jgi:hypothetical protein
MIAQTVLSLSGDSIMGSFRKNSRRPQVEELEHRCTPGSVLDLLGDPLLAPLGQSLVFLEATETAVSVATANLSHTSSPQETAAKVDSAFPADAQGVRVNSSQPIVIDGALLATSASVSAQGNTILASPAAAQEQVPFKGSLEGLDITTAVNLPFVSVQVTATGNATQLGNFTYTELATVDTRSRIGTGTFVFTAANGDTVSGTASGQATLTAPGVLTIEENAIITGGTGRFAGATGTFTVTRLKDTVTFVTTGSFEGTISSPGASKP